jgi:DNA repair protein RecO (recombination protein O)
MIGFTTSGVLIRRIDYGDYDYILTFLTLDRGKMSVIAKNAKKSVKRFLGTLELFSLLEITCQYKTRSGIAVLKEAFIEEPFEGIRTDMLKTAYASYWAELISLFLEERVSQNRLFRLLVYALSTLDSRDISPHQLSLLFQIRFLNMLGLTPHFESCGKCRRELERFTQLKIRFDLEKGVIMCDNCATEIKHGRVLSKGTIKQLIWLQNGDFQITERIRCSVSTTAEGLNFLEAFVPFHTGASPRSLSVLRRIRRDLVDT